MIRHLLILPLLAAFLVAFNTETVYVPEDLPADYLPGTGDKTVELTIDKNTTDAELTEIKEKLGKDQIDFSYTTVRNEAREIISLTLYLAGKNSQGKSFSGSYQSGDDTPIEPVLVHYDDSRNSVSFSSGGSHDSGLHMHSGNADKMVWITADDDEGGDAKEHKIVVRSRDSRDGNVMVWRSGDEPTREIEIRQVEGDTLIMVNGKEVSKAEWHEMDDSGDKVHKIKVSKTVKRDGKHVMVFRDSDDDADIEVIDGGSGGFFFIDSGKGEKPLFYIDGKKASEKQVRALKPDAIEKIEVLKGDQATSEYGKKAKDGVVLITTKSK